MSCTRPCSRHTFHASIMLLFLKRYMRVVHYHIPCNALLHSTWVIENICLNNFAERLFCSYVLFLLHSFFGAPGYSYCWMCSSLYVCEIIVIFSVACCKHAERLRSIMLSCCSVWCDQRDCRQHDACRDIVAQLAEIEQQYQVIITCCNNVVCTRFWRIVNLLRHFVLLKYIWA